MSLVQMKGSVEDFTRLLNESRAEITSLKLELESLMASKTFRSMQNKEAEAAIIRLEPVSSAEMANSETESRVVQLDPTLNPALTNPETETGTAVLEFAVEKMKISSVKIIGANEDFSFVGDILEVILENSMTLIDSNISMASGEQESREDILSANAHVSSRESQNKHEPVCSRFYAITLTYSGAVILLYSQALVANRISDAYSHVRFCAFRENEYQDAQLTFCLLCLQEAETVQILADALPKIVPYVLINHREVLTSTVSPNIYNI